MPEPIHTPIKMKPWEKVQCHSPEFSEIETDAITYLALQNSEIQPALLRVCMAPQRNVVASVKGIPFDLFLKTLVKTNTDARIALAAACTVLSRMHQKDMLHLEAVPRNFVVVAQNDAMHPNAVKFALSHQLDQLYSIHLTDFETTWRRNPPAATKRAFDAVAHDLKDFNYQPHAYYADHFEHGVKFDMHALLIGTACMLKRANLHHSCIFKRVFKKCIRLANMDKNPKHCPKSVHSPIDNAYYDYFLLEFEANVASPEVAAQRFAPTH